VGLLAGGPALFGWAAGALWNWLNLHLLRRFAALLSRPVRQVRRPLAWLAVAKFGLLYPAGILVLGWRLCPLPFFVAGFTAVLAVVAVAAALPGKEIQRQPIHA
jgi:CHASE2 domain-containing sensor protein